jgi:uncharacterized membrane protein
MKNKSSRTALSYIKVVIAIVIVLMVSLSKQTVGATTRHTKDYFEEGPRTVEVTDHHTTTFYKVVINGRVAVCCYVNPLYHEFVNHDNPRSFENID